jgi:hypothetical protein
MTIEEINVLVHLYGNLHFNAGSYSQRSGQIEGHYLEQAADVNAQLLEAIKQYKEQK